MAYCGDSCGIFNYDDKHYRRKDSSDFEDAVLTAINWGGDSDTIGAITGGLAGCYYGYDNIPTRFIEAIPSDIKKMLDTIIEAIPN